MTQGIERAQAAVSMELRHDIHDQQLQIEELKAQIAEQAITIGKLEGEFAALKGRLEPLLREHVALGQIATEHTILPEGHLVGPFSM